MLHLMVSRSRWPNGRAALGCRITCFSIDCAPGGASRTQFQNLPLGTNMTTPIQPTALDKAIKYYDSILDNYTYHWQRELMEQLLLAAKRAQELEKELKQEKIWKIEDPRMLREQLRILDQAFQYLHSEHFKTEQEEL